MKIEIDSTWHYVFDVETEERLLSLNAYTFEALMQKILNKTQYAHSMDRDGTYTLSKKAEKILMEEIAKHKKQ